MGEYATSQGEQVEIGSCEDLYYLRYDQRLKVVQCPNSLDPADPEILGHLRFRFPWPDEDHVEPGAFEDFNRALGIHGVAPSPAAEHNTVQFRAQNGYLVSLPCPESDAEQPFRIGRNGYQGAVHLGQQALRGGVLAPVFKCGGCGAGWSCPDPKDAEPYIESLTLEARKCMDRNDARAGMFAEVAKRIVAGYETHPTPSTSSSSSEPDLFSRKESE